MLLAAPTARKAPGFLWVTVTVFVLDAAVTPTAAGHAATAVATLEAKVLLLELVANVPAVELPHPFEPLLPVVKRPHEKVLSAPPKEKADTVVSPGVRSVAVTVLPLALAVTPAPVGHALIAAARLVAKVERVALVANVPAVAVVHAFEPFEPAVTAPHENLPRFVATLKVVKVPGVVFLAVTAPALTLALSPTVEKELVQLVIAVATFEATPDAVAAVQSKLAGLSVRAGQL